MEYSGGARKGSGIEVKDYKLVRRTLLTTILNPQHFVVYQAWDGKKELWKAYDLHSDLIVQDIRIPSIAGSGSMCSSARNNEISDSDGQVSMIPI